MSDRNAALSLALGWRRPSQSKSGPVSISPDGRWYDEPPRPYDNLKALLEAISKAVSHD